MARREEAAAAVDQAPARADRRALPVPVLADVPIERLNAAHCATVFDRIELLNAESARPRDEDRAPAPDGDVRTRAYHVGMASQHRVYAALREFAQLPVEEEARHPLQPVFGVELEAEETPEAQRWSAAEAARFLAGPRSSRSA